MNASALEAAFELDDTRPSIVKAHQGPFNKIPDNHYLQCPASVVEFLRLDSMRAACSIRSGTSETLRQAEDIVAAINYGLFPRLAEYNVRVEHEYDVKKGQNEFYLTCDDTVDGQHLSLRIGEFDLDDVWATWPDIIFTGLLQSALCHRGNAVKIRQSSSAILFALVHNDSDELYIGKEQGVSFNAKLRDSSQDRLPDYLSNAIIGLETEEQQMQI